MSLFRTAHCELESYLRTCECEMYGQNKQHSPSTKSSCAAQVPPAAAAHQQGGLSGRDQHKRNSNSSDISGCNTSLSTASNFDERSAEGMMLEGNRNSLLQALSQQGLASEDDFSLALGSKNEFMHGENNCTRERNPTKDSKDSRSSNRPLRSVSGSVKRKSPHKSSSSRSSAQNSDQDSPSDISSSDFMLYDRSRYATRFTSEQNRVLTEWYEQHEDMPYASDEKILELAADTNLSEKSVRKWLSNKRSRKRNTNPLGHVVAFKKNKFSC